MSRGRHLKEEKLAICNQRESWGKETTKKKKKGQKTQRTQRKVQRKRKALVQKRKGFGKERKVVEGKGD